MSLVIIPDEPEEEPRLPDPSQPRRGKAHRGGPPMEQRAADLVTPRTGTQRMRVLAALYEAGGAGKTDLELSDDLGMYYSSVAARRNELMNDGWVCRTDMVRETKHHATAHVWTLTEDGRSQYHQHMTT